MEPINQNLAKVALAQYKRDHGIDFGDQCVGFTEPAWNNDFRLAMDAQPQMVSTPSSGIPAFLTTQIEPNALKVLTAKNSASKILGEERKGNFVDVTWVFPVVEHDGQVSSYGDFSNDGNSDVNMNFPQRENFIFQIVSRYGQLEMERAALAKIGWAGEKRAAALDVLAKFLNTTYFFGVAGLQNYGILNAPGYFPANAPAPKAYNSGTSGPWLTGNVTTATSLEIFTDIHAGVSQLILQSSGNVTAESEMVLALSPSRRSALNTPNEFNVNVYTLLKDNFPNMRVQDAVQYGALTAQNPQGSAAGEIMQIIAVDVEGQKTGFAAFSEKLRAGPVVLGMSDFKQKMSSGSWGAVIRQPFAVSTTIGI